MTPDDLKWALIDTLRLLNELNGGQYSSEFQRIASTLGVELPEVGQREIERGMALPVTTTLKLRKNG